MYTLNVTLEVWDPDEIDEGVFKTVLTHPMFGGSLTFLSGSKEEADAFLKNLRNQFNAKYQDQISKPAKTENDDWDKQLSEVIELGFTLSRALAKRKK